MKERVIIQEFDMSCLQDVRDGMFLYEYNSKNEKIDIKKSAELWWDKHHKSSMMYVNLECGEMILT